MSKTDDTQLIERCRSGDRQAFEALLVEYEKPVFNAAYRMLNSRDDAQDVTQTVFLKVFENHFLPWVRAHEHVGSRNRNPWYFFRLLANFLYVHMIGNIAAAVANVYANFTF